MTSEPIPDETLLLAEYKHFSEFLARNEEIGEKRVTFFITLTTAIIAGVITLTTSDLPANSLLYNAQPIATVVLLGTIFFGAVTFARILKRNRVTDECKGILDYVREQLRARSAGLTEYAIPFRKQPRTWFSAGLAETVAVMNGLLSALVILILLPQWWGWLLALVGLILTFILQKVVSNRSRSKERDSSTQRFRAGVGAVIRNDAGEVMLFKRKGTSDSWQFPQGGLDVGEDPLVGVIREVWEETGIEAHEIELLPIESKLTAYIFPPAARWTKTGRGQVHSWYFFKFIGPEASITLGDGLEFSDWKWASMDEAIELVVGFKREVYEELARYLARQEE